jgi:PhnB protein
MKVQPYLFFNGNCEEALKFYETALGAKITAIMPHEGTPAEEHVPANWKKKIMHAQLMLGDQMILASDSPPEHYKKPEGISVTLNADNGAEAERVFKAVGRRHHHHADRRDLLGRTLRHADRQVRHALDDQLAGEERRELLVVGSSVTNGVCHECSRH